MSDDKFLTVQRTINAPAKEIFDVLTNPDRHAETDPSGMVRSCEQGDRLASVGQQFVMNMYAEAMGGDYQISNHVTGLQENKLVAWQPAQRGQEPAGWEWLYELEPEGSDSTRVSLTYDWSRVTDKKVLDFVKFPLFSAEQLEDSLAKLAESVEGS